MRYRIELTGSQVMALRTMLAHQQLCEGAPEVYVDCSQDPPVETRPEELLLLLLDAQPVHGEVPRGR